MSTAAKYRKKLSIPVLIQAATAITLRRAPPAGELRMAIRRACPYNGRLKFSVFSKQRFLMRPSGRTASQIRPISFTRCFTAHAEGSVLVEFGNTKVLCTASVEEGVPRFMKGQGKGWITAEYGMRPRATHTRNDREAARGKQSGRTAK